MAKERHAYLSAPFHPTLASTPSSSSSSSFSGSGSGSGAARGGE